MKKMIYNAPKCDVMQLQSSISQCQTASPTVIGQDDPIPGMFD